MPATSDNSASLRPYSANPFYWQYRGTPVVLLGSSSEDNLFQVEGVEAELLRLSRSGGNYVRCTMSSRDPENVWPFDRVGTTYDLTKPGQEYWRRFRRFLSECDRNGIVVQIEVWDRFDFARAPWLDNPFNPTNNVNYTEAQSGLRPRIDSHPGRCENDFFHAVPKLQNNDTLLPHQRRFVDWLLDATLPYDSIVYCMDNETNDDPEWGWYWARYIRERAAGVGKQVFLTEMWDAHDVGDPQHRNTIDHPELFGFVDISQNNHSPADRHWSNAVAMRELIEQSGNLRPMNSVKIYGSNDGRFGNRRDAEERFWRNIFAGLASTRFHRPPSGIGASPRSLRHVQSMRMLCDAYPFHEGAPRRDLLSNNSWNEAYCNAASGGTYAVFFTDGGNVLLNVGPTGGIASDSRGGPPGGGRGVAGGMTAGRRYSVRWLEIDACRWHPVRHELEDEGLIRLMTPADEGYWAALVQASE